MSDVVRPGPRCFLAIAIHPRERVVERYVAGGSDNEHPGHIGNSAHERQISTGLIPYKEGSW